MRCCGERLIAGLSAAAALLAVVLACLGLYGLLAFSVVTASARSASARRWEPPERDRWAMVVRAALRVIVLDVLIGIPVALAAAQLVRSRLHDIVPDDPKALPAPVRCSC